MAVGRLLSDSLHEIHQPRHLIETIFLIIKRFRLDPNIKLNWKWYLKVLGQIRKYHQKMRNLGIPQLFPFHFSFFDHRSLPV